MKAEVIVEDFEEATKVVKVEVALASAPRQSVVRDSSTSPTFVPPFAPLILML